MPINGTYVQFKRACESMEKLWGVPKPSRKSEADPRSDVYYERGQVRWWHIALEYFAAPQRVGQGCVLAPVKFRYAGRSHTVSLRTKSGVVEA